MLDYETFCKIRDHLGRQGLTVAQPTEKELDDDAELHRFVIVFNRECSNYKFISQLWEQRIGAITYQKNVKDKWPAEEFVEQVVPVLGGGSTKMKLAMRQTTLSSGKQSISVAEVRRLPGGNRDGGDVTQAPQQRG